MIHRPRGVFLWASLALFGLALGVWAHSYVFWAGAAFYEKSTGVSIDIAYGELRVCRMTHRDLDRYRTPEWHYARGNTNNGPSIHMSYTEVNYVWEQPPRGVVMLMPLDVPLRPLRGIRQWHAIAYALGASEEVNLGGDYCDMLYVPLWPFAMAAGLWPLLILSLRAVARRRQRQRGLCVACGYDLRASPERCPECGRTARP